MNQDSRIVMTDFALRHFDASEHAPAIPQDPSQFIGLVNRWLYLSRHGMDFTLRQVADGYAPFCKILYYENWTMAKLGIVQITRDNEPLIESVYEARRETELPVLMRYLPESKAIDRARFLAVIVYDKEQMAKEGSPIDGDYAVVNILRLAEREEPPIPPITMMRNALGVAEGGSGIPLDRDAYLKSVEYWSRHVAVKPAERKQT